MKDKGTGLKCRYKCFELVNFSQLRNHTFFPITGVCEVIRGSLRLVDLLDGRTSTASSSSSCSTWCATHASHVRHSSGHSSWSTSSVSIQLGDDGVANTLNLLLLLVELLNLGKLVGVQPLDGLIALVVDSLLVVFADLVLDLVVIESGLHIEAVALKSILGRNPVLLLVVLSLELLSIADHSFDFLLGKPSLVIGDRDLVLLASGLVSSGDVEDTVGVNVEGHFDLGNTSRSRRNASEIELAQIVVVLGHGTLALVHLDRHSGLVVTVGGEGLGLLGGDGGVPLDQGSHHTSSSLNAERQRGHIEEQQVGHSFAGVASEDGSLNSSTIGNSLIRVDRLVQLLAIEEVLQELLHLWDPGGASNQHDVVDAALVHLGVAHRLLHWLKGALEEVRAQLLEPCSGDGGVEVDALEQGIDFDVGLSRCRQGPLGSLTSSAKTPQGTLVALHVLLVLAFELVDEVVHHAVVEVFSPEVSVTSSGLDLEDALLDGKDGDIKGTASEVENEDVTLIGS